ARGLPRARAGLAPPAATALPWRGRPIRPRRSRGRVAPRRGSYHSGRNPHSRRAVDQGMILFRAGKRLLAHNGTMLASALAYGAFFAIPSVLLVVVGLFTLVVGPGTITALMQHFNHVMPSQATTLLG